MTPATALRLPALLLACLWGMAAAAPPQGEWQRSALSSTAELQRNGALSRHLWAPSCCRSSLGGLPLSVGLAIGLRGGVRANLGQSVAPALSLQLGARSHLSLLAGDKGGGMLVLQSTQ